MRTDPAVAALRWTDVEDELTMQAHVDGAWHRRTPDLGTTACGKHKIHAALSPVRPESYAGPLCQEGCFSPYEHGLAAEIVRKEREHMNGGK